MSSRGVLRKQNDVMISKSSELRLPQLLLSFAMTIKKTFSTILDYITDRIKLKDKKIPHFFKNRTGTFFAMPCTTAYYIKCKFSVKNFFSDNSHTTIGKSIMRLCQTNIEYRHYAFYAHFSSMLILRRQKNNNPNLLPEEGRLKSYRYFL